MIRNEQQLTQAKSLLSELTEQIRRIREEGSPEEKQFLLKPIIQQKNKTEAEVEEFESLTSHGLATALRTTLRKPHLLDNLIELLVKLRIASGISQEELAHLTGWQQPNVSRFESRTSPNHTILKALEYASALGVHIHVRPSLKEDTTELSFPHYRADPRDRIQGYGRVIFHSGAELEREWIVLAQTQEPLFEELGLIGPNVLEQVGELGNSSSVRPSVILIRLEGQRRVDQMQDFLEIRGHTTTSSLDWADEEGEFA